MSDVLTWAKAKEKAGNAYKDWDPEQRLNAFKKWQSIREEDYGRALEDDSIKNPSQANLANWYRAAKLIELKYTKDVNIGEVTPEWNDKKASDELDIYNFEKAQHQERRADYSWFTDNSLNMYGKGIFPRDQRKPEPSVLSFVKRYEGDDMGFPDTEAGSEEDYETGFYYHDASEQIIGNGSPKYVSLPKEARDWYKNQIELSPYESYSWVARDIGTFGTDKKEVNIYRSLLGEKEFAEGLKKTDVLNSKEKARALADYSHSRELTMARLRGYIQSRTTKSAQIRFEEEEDEEEYKGLWDYIFTGKFLDTLGKTAVQGGLGAETRMGVRGAHSTKNVLEANNLGDPRIDASDAPIFGRGFLKRVSNFNVLANRDYLTDPEKWKELVDVEIREPSEKALQLPADFLMEYFLPKVGMEDVVSEIRSEGPKAEAYRESLNELFFDALTDIPEAWHKDQDVVWRAGNYREDVAMVNPELYKTLTPKQMDERLALAGLNQEDINRHVESSIHIQEEDAKVMHGALLFGPDPTELSDEDMEFLKDFGGPSSLENLSKKQLWKEFVYSPISRSYRAYLTRVLTEQQTEKQPFDPKTKTYHGWEEGAYGPPGPSAFSGTHKELIQGFQDQMTEPTQDGFKAFKDNVLRNHSPIGWFGQLLTSMNDHPTLQSWGTGMENFEYSIVRALPMLEKGVEGIIKTITSGDDSILRELKHINSKLGKQRAASPFPTGAKWGDIFGRESAYIAATMLFPGGGLARATGGAAKVPFWTLNKMPHLGQVSRGTQGFVRGRIEAGRGLLPTLPKVRNYASFDKLMRSQSIVTKQGFKDFKGKLAGRSYFGLQAGRSGEAVYREAFIAHKDRLIAAGISAEDAHSSAVGYAGPLGILASLVTGTLMKVIPGGTERVFERGINKLTKKELIEALNISEGEYRRALQDVVFRKQAKALISDYYRVPLLGRKLGNRVIRGGRHAAKETAEESIDELFQGVLAMQT